MAGYVIGSDIGTSSCKSIVLDDAGSIRGWAKVNYPTIREKSGWAEQHPQDWFDAFCSSAQQALEAAEISASDVNMICIVGITHNAVLLDKNDRVIRPAINYTDTRSTPQAERLRTEWGDDAVLKRTFNNLSPLWTWPQLEWLKEHEPESIARVEHIMFPKDYVRHRLSPGYVTDHVDPYGTLLFDGVQQIWIDEYCQSVGLSVDVFPRVESPYHIVGQVTSEGAQASGLAEGIPIIVGTTDTASEVIGSGMTRPGQFIVKLATVGRLMALTEKPVMEPYFLNYPHVNEGLWYPGTSTKFAASAYTWLRNSLWDQGANTPDYSAMDDVATTVPSGSAGLLFHPYLDGAFAPLWEPDLRASFVGVNINHALPHFTRAVMEGVGFAIRQAYESVTAYTGTDVGEIRLIGGGANSQLWSQIMCDMLNKHVLVPSASDAAFGASLLAGTTAGFFAKETIAEGRLIKIRAEFAPIKQHVDLYNEMSQVYQDTVSALRPISQRLKSFH